MTNVCLCSVQVKREVGDVSILVNNAGIVTGKKFMDAPDSLIEKTLEVNTMAHFWVSQTHQTCRAVSLAFLCFFVLWIHMVSYGNNIVLIQHFL